MLGLEVFQPRRLGLCRQRPGQVDRGPEVADAALLVQSGRRAHDVREPPWRRNCSILRLDRGREEPLPHPGGLPQQRGHVAREEGRVVPQARHEGAQSHLQDDLRGAGRAEQPAHDLQQGLGRRLVVPSARPGGQVVEELRGQQDELRLHLPPAVVHELGEAREQLQDAGGVLLRRRRHGHQDGQPGDADLGLQVLQRDQGVVPVVREERLVEELGLHLQRHEV
mmetsp:Transcript_65308/g.199865  ORF Transcript_65308/g.199865 Transcript_65308/m.199865 type:complete len:224 (-) Transcript_65308:1662-2333(-)